MQFALYYYWLKENIILEGCHTRTLSTYLFVAIPQDSLRHAMGVKMSIDYSKDIDEEWNRIWGDFLKKYGCRWERRCPYLMLPGHNVIPPSLQEIL
jgi:hypothetical protein